MRKVLPALILVALIAGLAVGLAVKGSREPTTVSDEAYALYIKGNEQLTAFQHGRAVETLGKALSLDPDFAMAAVARAEGFNVLGLAAERDSLMALADSLAGGLKNPVERMLVQLRLADLGAKEGVARVDSLHEALLKAAPDDIILLTSLANAAKRRLDGEEAERYFRKILKINPNYAAAYNELGYIEFYRGNLEAALDMLRRYAFLAPDLANPYDSLGEILLESGRYAEAEEQLKFALARQHDYLPSLLHLARVYLLQGQIGKGTGLIDEIQAQTAGSPVEREVRVFAIMAFNSQNLWDELDAATAQFIDLYPKSLASIRYRGIRMAATGRHTEAEALVDSLIGSWKNEPSYRDRPAAKTGIDALELELQAQILQYQGRYAEAAEKWAKDLELVRDRRRPQDLNYPREQLGLCLLQAGDPQSALEPISAILELNPAYGPALAHAAQACLDLGRAQDADLFLTSLESSLANADPDYPLRERATDLRTRLSALAGTPEP